MTLRFLKGKKRHPNNENENEQIEREPKNPRIENIVDDAMVIDDANTLPSPSPSSSSSSSYLNNDPIHNIQHYTQTNEVSSEMKKLCLENTTETTVNACNVTLGLTNHTLQIASVFMDGASNVAQNFSLFSPLISSFLELGKEIIKLYERAEHNKNLCSFLLQRCNCAVAA